MDKELIKVVIQGVLAVMVLGATLYLMATGQTSEALFTLAGVVLGFYFKSGADFSNGYVAGFKRKGQK